MIFCPLCSFFVFPARPLSSSTLKNSPSLFIFHWYFKSYLSVNSGSRSIPDFMLIWGMSYASFANLYESFHFSSQPFEAEKSSYYLVVLLWVLLLLEEMAHQERRLQKGYHWWYDVVHIYAFCDQQWKIQILLSISFPILKQLLVLFADIKMFSYLSTSLRWMLFCIVQHGLLLIFLFRLRFLRFLRAGSWNFEQTMTIANVSSQIKALLFNTFYNHF